MVFAVKLCCQQLFYSLADKQMANECINYIKMLSEKPILWLWTE